MKAELQMISMISTMTDEIKARLKIDPDWFSDGEIQKLLSTIAGYALEYHKPSISVDQLKAFRKRQGLTQQEAANIASVSLAKFKRWEKFGVNNKKVNESKFIISMIKAV